MDTYNINATFVPSVHGGTNNTTTVAKSTEKVFIEANTTAVSYRELKDEHIIPVFSATNEPLISHQELIDCVATVTRNWFQDEVVLEPSIRVSHPIKGRIPDAKYKKASELEVWEQTLFYERMMFCIEVPSVAEMVGGNLLSLTIGAVKAYSEDNLYGKRPSGEQQFHLFVGFRNKVCCNMCVSTDGAKLDLKVKDLAQLEQNVYTLLSQYNVNAHIEAMRKYTAIEINQSEFAQFIGKSRLYKYLPDNLKLDLTPLCFGDQQMGAVAKDFFNDDNFSATLETGTINLWRLYNLLTGVNKSTYIDQFLERAINAQELVIEIAQHKTGQKSSWYLE
jgi:hypothetical protein